MAATVPRHRVYPAVAAAALLVGCTTVETQSFNVAKESRVEAAHIAVDADFGKYDTLQAVDMGIYFPTGAQFGAEDSRRLRQIFRDAFLDQLGAYSITSEPGPTTMTVQATLIDLRSGGDVPALARGLEDIASSGSLVFLMELKDSESGRTLARAADSARTPALASADGAQTDWVAVEDAAQHWATLFGDFLDKNFNQ
jgi:hypothetical protein